MGMVSAQKRSTDLSSLQNSILGQGKMTRPQLDATDEIYLRALCGMTGESKHGAISRALIYACKNAWCRPEYAHYQAVARQRLSDLREADRAVCK